MINQNTAFLLTLDNLAVRADFYQSIFSAPYMMYTFVDKCQTDTLSLYSFCQLYLLLTAVKMFCNQSFPGEALWIKNFSCTF